ncbi:MAG: T9SS type A sorting domain-containing protein [bacterium]
MKKFLSIIICNFITLVVVAQTTDTNNSTGDQTSPIIPMAPAPGGGNKMVFSYDDAGNRIKTIFYIQTLKSAKIDSFYNEELEEEIGKNIKLYPNPTRGIIYLEIKGYDLKSPSNLVLSNTTGTVLEHRTNLSSALSLNLSDFPDGIYLLQIIIDDSRWEWKIIKE